MVTQRDLGSLLDAAEFFPEADRQAIEAAWLIAWTTGMPDWEPHADTMLRQSLALSAEQVAIWMNMSRANQLRVLVAFAQGPQLDILGLGPPPTIRREGEPDDSYRLRIINAHARLNLGSLDGVDQQVEETFDLLREIHSVVSPNRQDVRVFVLRADAAQATMMERDAVVAHLAQRDQHIAGVQFTCHEPVVRRYRVVSYVTYDPRSFGQAEVEAAVRAHIYRSLLAVEGIGDSVFVNFFCANLPETITLEPRLFVPEAVAHGANALVQYREAARYTSGGNSYRLVANVNRTDDPGMIPSSPAGNRYNWVMNGAQQLTGNNPAFEDERGNRISSAADGDWFLYRENTRNPGIYRRVGTGVVAAAAEYPEDAPYSPADPTAPVWFANAGTSWFWDERVDDLYKPLDSETPNTPALVGRDSFQVADRWYCPRDTANVAIRFENTDLVL